MVKGKLYCHSFQNLDKGTNDPVVSQGDNSIPRYSKITLPVFVYYLHEVKLQIEVEMKMKVKVKIKILVKQDGRCQ